MVSRTYPPELARLRERMAEVADLRGIAYLLLWDQNTMMPPNGATSRGHRSATLSTLAHERQTDPEVGRLLDALEPWAAEQDPDGIDARAIRWFRRDFEKTVRVPAALAADMSRADSLGQAAWGQARAAEDFSLFRDALERHVELRQRYAACFDVAHPYDAMLDTYEPGLTTAELQPILTELREALVPLVAAATGSSAPPPPADPFAGPYETEVQRAAVTRIAESLGFDSDSWRLDASPHPFAQPVAPEDMRITTRYAPDKLRLTLYMVLHEFGHGLYDAGLDPAIDRTSLADGASMGVHESQSRLWENFVGRSRPFTSWLHGRLDELLPGGFGQTDPDGLYRAVNSVRATALRLDADETTYNLHIVLRTELELAMIEGRLAVDDVPAAWEEGMQRLLCVEVPGPNQGPLQDMHWSSGLIGYFPTYTLGNLIGAQFWSRIAADLPALDEQLERGEFGPLTEWLRENVHRYGRMFEPRELLRRVTGEELSVTPLVDYLGAKLVDAGIVPAETLS
jgi:carboxypeptidase Taq